MCLVGALCSPWFVCSLLPLLSDGMFRIDVMTGTWKYRWVDERKAAAALSDQQLQLETLTRFVRNPTGQKVQVNNADH